MNEIELRSLENMRVERVELTNFRKFASFTMDLHPELTVLVGENGSGKTSVLAGLAGALGRAVVAFDAADAPHRRLDIRFVLAEIEGVPDLQPQLPCRCAAKVSSPVLGLGLEVFGCDLSLVDGKLLVLREPTHEPFYASLAANGSEPPIELPVIASYPSTRAPVAKKQRLSPKREVGARQDGYTKAFAPSLEGRSFEEWFYQQTLAELQAPLPQSRIAGVSAAVAKVFHGATKLEFSVRRNQLEVLFASRDRLPFASMSDGQRVVAGLVADIAWRATVLNPQHGERAAELSPGVVLIDEVDLHLHPSWQRRVLADLRAAFPRVQFVVTTHSPQVVASVNAENIRVLRDDRAVPLDAGVHGRASNDVLQAAFGDPGREPEIAAKVRALQAAVDADDRPRARALIEEISRAIEGVDPEVEFYAQLLPPS